MKESSRQERIIRTSLIGILVNLLIAAVKIVIGTLASSIAIVSEGINNATDAGSSFLTYVGTKLSGKHPDEKHPFGYGRIEYLTGMVVGILILYAGISMLKESIDGILHPSDMKVSMLMGEEAITLTLMLFGVAGIIAGQVFARFYVRGPLRFIGWMTAGMSVCLILLWPSCVAAWLVVGVSLLWGVCNTCCNVASQSELIALTPPDGTAVAMSIYSGIFNLGIGTGAAVGGVVCAAASVSWIGIVVPFVDEMPAVHNTRGNG